jgi:c-di-AMP phosphodiesterase-like protein
MQTHIIYRKEIFLKVIVYLLITFAVEIVFLEVVKSTALSAIGVIIMILPFPFMPLLFRAFTRQVHIGLDPDQFNFQIEEKGDQINKVISMSSLESYSIQYPNERFCSIRFNTSDGKSQEFSFFTRKRDPADTDSAELLELFRKSIYSYNSRKEITRKIVFRPSFYARKEGFYCIVGLSVFLFVGICIASFYKEKTIPLTFLTSLVLIVQLILKRDKDLKYYRKYSTMPSGE